MCYVCENIFHLSHYTPPSCVHALLPLSMAASLPPSLPLPEQVTLLLHTFKEEKRRNASEDRKFYSECSPCEVYDSLVGESLYFHHFIGKNFLYAAVVGYRK